METGMGVEEHGEVMGRKPATYADLEALPEHVVGELIAGELHVEALELDLSFLWGER
jgi:hypothetical protein